MKHLRTLLKWDAILFNRNRLFVLSLIVVLVYTGGFYLLKPLGNLDTVLIILIFNDPIVTGFIFAGVLLLFDKSQNTLQAIAVLPLPFRQYLLSKTLLLSLLAVVTALVMTLAIRGVNFNWIHLIAATFFSAAIFALIGFSISSLTGNFNQLLFYAVPFLIICGSPLLPLFGIGQPWYFLPVPSTGGIQLLKASVTEADGLTVMLSYLHLLLWTFISWKLALHITKRAV